MTGIAAATTWRSSKQGPAPARRWPTAWRPSWLPVKDVADLSPKREEKPQGADLEACWAPGAPHKLPRLAGIIPELTYDILKGRARYVCESRLEGVINDVMPGSELTSEFQDLFADARRPAASVVRDRKEAMRWFKSSAKKLNSGSWNGDIDSLGQPPDPQDWRQVQANAHACNGGQCEHFRSCAFFKARRQAAARRCRWPTTPWCWRPCRPTAA